MKKFVFLILIAFAFSLKARAQEKFSITDFKKHVTKKVTMCNVVSSYKIFSDTLTMLNMGGKYPDQTFTLVITGNEIPLNFDTLVGKHICVTGDLSTYMGKPEILIYHQNQIVFK